MRYFAILLFLGFFPEISLGQDSFILEGEVIDAESRKPVVFASIGFPTKHIGTASRGDGTFRLKVSEVVAEDSLQVSAIGYQTKKFHVSTFLDKEQVRLQLDPKTYQMEAITVTNRTRSAWIGKKIPPLIGSASYGFLTHPERLGAAFAFRVKWDKELPIKILYSRIFLKRDRKDSLNIRCGIAKVDPDTNLPSDEFLNKPVISSAAKGKGWMTCDFDEERVVIPDKEFFVVFEWLNREEEPIVPMIATGMFFKSESYIRHHALAEWETSSVDNLIYSVKVEY